MGQDLKHNVNQAELPKNDGFLQDSLTEISTVMNDLRVLADVEEEILPNCEALDVEEKIHRITNAKIDMQARVRTEKDLSNVFQGV